VGEIRKRSDARKKGQAERAAIRAEEEMDKLLEVQTKEAHKAASSERVQLDLAESKAAKAAAKVLYKGQQREHFLRQVRKLNERSGDSRRRTERLYDS
jgi:hypothetical protein